MKRRQFLATLAAGSAAGVAGTTYVTYGLSLKRAHNPSNFNIKQMKQKMTELNKPAVIICVDGQEQLLMAVSRLNNIHMNSLKVSHLVCFAYRNQLTELKLPTDKNIIWYGNDFKRLNYIYIDYQKCQGQGGLAAKLSDTINGKNNANLNERIAAFEKTLKADDEKQLLSAYTNLEAEKFKQRRDAKNTLLVNGETAKLLLLKGRFQNDKIETKQTCIEILNQLGPKQLMLGVEVFGIIDVKPGRGFHGDGCPACGLGYIPNPSASFLNVFNRL